MEHKVVLADDHEAVRDGVAKKIAKDPRFSISGFTYNAHDTVGFVSATSPDLLLLDLHMPLRKIEPNESASHTVGMTGLNVIAALREHGVHTKIIAYSGFDGHELVREALTLGADAYLAKHSPLRELVKLMHTVLGEEFVPGGDRRSGGSLASTLAAYQKFDLARPGEDWEWEAKSLLVHLNRKILDPALQIGVIISHLGLSRTRAVMAFRRFVGTGPKAYVVRHRLQLSERLVRLHGLTLSEAASFVGFNSVSALQKAKRRQPRLAAKGTT